MIREKQNKKKPQKKREKILYLKTITADTLHMQQCCIVILGNTEKKEFCIAAFLTSLVNREARTVVLQHKYLIFNKIQEYIHT